MKNELAVLTKQAMTKRLQELVKEFPTRTISSLRRDVLTSFKDMGLIKDYVFRSYINNKIDNTRCFYFGSCIGFDMMYLVIL